MDENPALGTDLTNDMWTVINNYFTENPNWMARHQIDSYNDFVENKIPLIMKNINRISAFMFDKVEKDVTYKVDIYLGGKTANKFRIAPPTIYDHKTQQMRPLFPNEARLKNLTYGFDIFVDMELEYSSKRDDVQIFDGLTLPDTSFLNNIYLGRIPIMLHSNMCSLNKIPLDALPEFGESAYEPGGYFIIDGREKVFLSQERKVENSILLTAITDSQQKNKYKHSAEIKSVNDEGFTSPRNNKLLLESAGTITFLVGMEDKPFIMPVEGRHVPLFILFRLLGIESDLDIMTMIIGDIHSELGKKMVELLKPCAHDPFIMRYHVYDKQNAEKYMEPLTSRSKTNITTGLDKLEELHKNKLNRLSFLYDTVYENIFPHTGPDFQSKAYYLAHMTRKLLLKELGIEKDTDRDSFLNKRVDTSGHLLATLFRETVSRGFMYNARREIESRFELSGNEFLGRNIVNIVHENNYYVVFNSSIFMNGIPAQSIPGFMSSLKRGKIGQKVGVIQSMDRINYYSMISHLRRLNDTPLGGRVQDKQRYLHNSQYGYLCPAETPEGQSVGLRKALALLTTITIGYPGNQLREICKQLGTVPLKHLKPIDTHKQTRVFINGDWFGCTINPGSLVDKFRLMRRNGLINLTTSISWYNERGEIYICSDTGRLVRPLLIIGPGNELLIQPGDLKAISTGKQQFSDLCLGKLMVKAGKHREFTDINIYKPDTMLELSARDPELYDKLRANQACIEYVDMLEMDTVLLAGELNFDRSSKNKYTHVDLHPAVIMGAMVQTCPFIHHGQGGKYFGHSKHIKQAVSAYTDNYWHRIDTSAHLLHNPEQPLIQTRMTGVMNHDVLGTGQNIIVAIAYYNGYNQDDAIIANNTSVDFGQFDSSYYKLYEDVEKKDEKGGTEERFYNPKFAGEFEEYPETLTVPDGDISYDGLDKYGFIKEGTYITDENTVLIGKYLNIKDQNNTIQHSDTSTFIKHDNLNSYVDKVYTCVTDYSKDARLCKVRTCQHRRPQNGDKFASRNGQKGTIGLYLPREDMPFTDDGIVPDMILHPSAYPKRMTVNQLLEMLYGNLAAECGFHGIANGLDSFDAETLNEVLCDKLGFTYYGDRVLYNGVYGEQMDCAIFMGPLYVQRLKLQVQDKINYRDTGYRKDGVPVPGGAYTVRERSVVSGRANGGGIKIGEMERDALIAHGLMGYLNERDIVRGDKFYVFVSTVNGEISIGNPADNIYFDTLEDGPLNYHLEDGTGQGRRSLIGLNTMGRRQNGFVRLTIPYAMKLLIQEINGIGMRLRLNPRVTRMLIDADSRNKSVNDMLLDMEDIITEDESKIAELLEKSISQQIESRLDLEANIEESYKNAVINQEPDAENVTLNAYKDAMLVEQDKSIDKELDITAGMEPFKHPEELPNLTTIPATGAAILTNPMVPGLPVISPPVLMPGHIQTPAILEPLPPIISPVNNQLGGAEAGQLKTVTFAPVTTQTDSRSSNLVPAELPIISTGGASEEDDFNLMPLNFKPRVPAGQDQLAGGGVGQDINFPQLSNSQSGGAMQPAQGIIKPLGVETKQINISGTERELSEMGVSNFQPAVL